MKFSLRTLIWVSVILALILAISIALIPKPIDVEFVTIDEGPLIVSVQEDGKTRIREKYIVSAPVGGRLTRIEHDAGDEIFGNKTLLAVIQPGDPAMLDARSRAQAEAQVRGAEASLRRSVSNSEQARIEFELSKSTYERVQRLLPKNVISQNEFDVAKAEYFAGIQAVNTSKFDVEIAEFELDMAQAAANQFGDSEATSPVDPFEIYSPIDGNVLRIFQESATVVEVGAPLLELGDPNNLEIEIDVLSTDAVRIKPGAKLTVEHWGGQSPLQGNVRVIEPAAFTKISSLGVEEQRVNIIADFDELPERIARLGDGYRVEARITIGQLDRTLRVPNSALFRYRRQWHVMKIDQGKAAMQRVTIGLQNESHTEVIEGLAKGEQVIVYPSDKIESGTSVRLVDRYPNGSQ